MQAVWKINYEVSVCGSSVCLVLFLGLSLILSLSWAYLIFEVHDLNFFSRIDLEPQ